MKVYGSGKTQIIDDPRGRDNSIVSTRHGDLEFCSDGDAERSYQKRYGQSLPQRPDITARDIAETASGTMVGPVADMGDAGTCDTASGVGQRGIDCGLLVVPGVSTVAIKKGVKNAASFLGRLFRRVMMLLMRRVVSRVRLRL